MHVVAMIAAQSLMQPRELLSLGCIQTGPKPQFQNPNEQSNIGPACCAQRLTYSRELLSLGFIVSDSLDYSAREVRKAVQGLDGDPFAGVLVLQRDYGYSQVGARSQPSNRTLARGNTVSTAAFNDY